MLSSAPGRFSAESFGCSSKTGQSAAAIDSRMLCPVLNSHDVGWSDDVFQVEVQIPVVGGGRDRNTDDGMAGHLHGRLQRRAGVGENLSVLLGAVGEVVGHAEHLLPRTAEGGRVEGRLPLHRGGRPRSARARSPPK